MNHHINCRGHTIWISKRSTGILTWNQTSQLNIRTSYRKENIMSERFFSQNLNQLKGFWENRVTVVADKLDIFPQKETDWCRQPAGCTAYPDNHYLPNETPLSGKKRLQQLALITKSFYQTKLKQPSNIYWRSPIHCLDIRKNHISARVDLKALLFGSVKRRCFYFLDTKGAIISQTSHFWHFFENPIEMTSTCMHRVPPWQI